jgi:DNA-binding HxlR family transcriptional regulator
MSPANTDVPALVGAALPTPVPMDEYDRCPVTDVVRLVSDRWSLVTLALLGRRTYRFNELHRSIEGISQRMLTRTLRNLEASGLVQRTVYATTPPTVDYRLTPLGESLLAPLSALADWAVQHASELAAARRAAESPAGTGGSPGSRRPPW